MLLLGCSFMPPSEKVCPALHAQGRITIYAPMIYTAPSIMFWMRAYREGQWEGVGPWNSWVFGTLWNGIEPIGKCHLGPKKLESDLAVKSGARLADKRGTITNLGSRQLFGRHTQDGEDGGKMLVPYLVKHLIWTPEQSILGIFPLS
jgi:hypothetical protein